MPVAVPVPSGHSKEDFASQIADLAMGGTGPLVGLTKAQTGPIFKGWLKEVLAKKRAGSPQIETFADLVSVLRGGLGLLEGRRAKIMEGPAFKDVSILSHPVYGEALRSGEGAYRPGPPSSVWLATPTTPWEGKWDLLSTLIHEGGGHHLTSPVSPLVTSGFVPYAKVLRESLEKSMPGEIERFKAFNKALLGFKESRSINPEFTRDTVTGRWPLARHFSDIDEVMANLVTERVNKKLGLPTPPFFEAGVWRGALPREGEEALDSILKIFLTPGP